MPELPLGAVIAFDFTSWNVQEEIALVRQVGVRRVQIYRNYAQGHVAEDIRRTIDEAGLVIDGLHGYFLLEDSPGPMFDPSSPDPAVRQAALDIMEKETAFAHVLGCRDIIVHPVCPGPTENEAGRREAFAESAHALTTLGEREDVRFLIENMPPPMFGRDVALVRRLVDEINSPHLGQCYDSGHATLAGDPIGTIRTMGPRLWGVHLHDNRGTEDDHLLPGMGVVPFEDVARALAEVGYSRTFMIEVYRPTAEVRRDLTPERLAFIEKLRRIASGI
jgi:sugar phosphate isomerase/epimerase